MRKPDARRIAIAARKAREAYDTLMRIDSYNLEEGKERNDYNFFRDNLWRMCQELEIWKDYATGTTT